MTRRRGDMPRHLSEPKPPEWVMEPPAGPLIPLEDLKALISELVHKLSLREPARASEPPVTRWCRRCGVPLQGAYQDDVCTSDWFAARGEA